MPVALKTLPPAEDCFLTGPPRVRLTKAFDRPFQNVVDTARTCYSAGGIVEGSEGYESLAKSIYQAGHHTTFQHPTFQFAIENISRHCLWSFLHAHTFYNSEQVSQRYVKVKAGHFVTPRLEGEAAAVYASALEAAQTSYTRLTKMLFGVAEAEYFRLFPARGRAPEEWKSTIRKRCYETARYVLPVATTAYLYHTVSGLTLLRYVRLCQSGDTPAESRLLAQAMLAELLKHDPSFEAVLEQPLPAEDLPEHLALATLGQATADWRGETDARLGGRMAVLVSEAAGQERLLADSVRLLLGVGVGQLSDEDAIRLALDPAQNRVLGQTLNLSSHHQLSRCLSHVHYVFLKKISHTADSQNQRHRMTPASRPVVARHLGEAPDYATPRLLLEDEKAHKEYTQAMSRAWEAMHRLRALGVEEQWVQYLLPNAVNLRFYESADLLNLRHKHVMRLCYNAQEEIWQASVDEAMQIRTVNPLIGQFLLPPCGVRHLARQKPICPEGDRYCGVRVWKLDLSEYQRVL